MTDILDLKGWKVTSSGVINDEYVIEGYCDIAPDACTKCGVIGNLYKHGPKKVNYTDSPIRGYPARLVAKVQRYKCRECDGTFLQPLEAIDTQRRMTVRCREYIEQQSVRDTFAHIAEHVGCDEKTIRNVAKPYIQRLNDAYQLQVPEWLGIDEVYVSKKLRCVLTDVGNRVPVDMLPDRGQRLVEAWLGRLPDRERIKGVTIDMWRPYRDMVRRTVPHAAIVVDKYHVLATVNRSLDRVRKSLRENQTAGERRKLMRSRHMLQKRPHRLNDKQRFMLDGWLKNVPELGVAYHLKEDFFNIYDLPAAEAGPAMRAWKDSIPEEMRGHFKESITAITNWEPEILAYFDHPYTNAYTEALNGVTKVVNRQGRGYTFEVLRARVLYRNKQPEPIQEMEYSVMEPVTYRRDGAMLRQFLLSKYGGQCQSCGGLFDHHELEIHHLKGEPENAVLLCSSCHRRIHDD